MRATDLNKVAATWTASLMPPSVMPDYADVVVIGGGIVGASTAWFLAKQGVSVVLCEKGHIAGEQSGRNWGWVRVQGRDTREIPMMQEALRIWDGMREETGEDVGFVRRGCYFTARTKKEMASFEKWVATAAEYGIESKLLSAEELDRHMTGCAVPLAGALYTETDGRAEPQKAAPAIARAAERAGARILTACAVRGVETSGGAVSAVVTEHGVIRTTTVLCAAGAWSSYFFRSLGIKVPQLRVRGTVARTAACDSVLEGNVFDELIGIRRRVDGGYTVAHGSILQHGITPSTLRWSIKFIPALMQELKTLRISFGKDFFDELRLPKAWALDEESPFEQTRILDPAPSKRVVRGIRQNLDTMFPQLQDVPIVEAWAGMVETTPDVVPMIGPVDGLPGMHIATGFSGHGFGLGPGAGKAIAGMLTGTDTGIDLQPLRLSRFFDGSRIRPQSTI
ncbi:MAG: FAD-binding oxidoreductase [Woeseiaceae bacterium]|nr:FAD-binding oxidoreductase [Woeseiaceae bacterium]